MQVADSALVNTLVNAVVSAAIGAGVTVIGFREKLALLKQQVDRNERDGGTEKLAASQALASVRNDFQTLCQQIATRADDVRRADRELFERLFQEGRRAFDSSERRQRYVMELVTAIAQKEGISHRLTDVLLATPATEREG